MLNLNSKQALEILNRLTEIHNHLIKNEDRSAFFFMGVLTEKLASIIRMESK